MQEANIAEDVGRSTDAATLIFQTLVESESEGAAEDQRHAQILQILVEGICRYSCSKSRSDLDDV